MIRLKKLNKKYINKTLNKYYKNVKNLKVYSIEYDNNMLYVEYIIGQSIIRLDQWRLDLGNKILVEEKI